MNASVIKLLYQHFKNLLKKPITSNEALILSKSASDGDVNNVDSILKHKILKEYHFIVSEVFYGACKMNQLEVVKYLMTSPNAQEFRELLLQSNIALNNALNIACQNGHLAVVSYLLTSPDIKKHPDIHYNNDSALVNACMLYKTDVAKFLISSPELKEHANVHASDDLFFRNANTIQDFEILQYLIFELNIEKTPSIERHINTFTTYQVQSDFMNKIDRMFAQRELNKKLEKDLNSDKVGLSKSKKIKI